MAKVIKPQERVLNCIVSKKTEQDWEFVHASQSGALAGAPAALPAAADMREAWWGINDQGYTGSCVGWAAADSLIRWHFVKGGQIPGDQLLSVRYVWMAAKESDEFTTRPTSFIELEGTSLKAALDVARKYGVVMDSDLPFGKAQLFQGDEKSFYAKAANLKIAAYFNLKRNLSNWRTWLATKGPIMTRLDVDATWDNAANTGGNMDTYQPDTVRGGHAVALVGYTADRFIVRNSWGTGWGDHGFGYASFSYAQTAFTEAYGVSI